MSAPISFEVEIDSAPIQVDVTAQQVSVAVEGRPTVIYAGIPVATSGGGTMVSSVLSSQQNGINTVFPLPVIAASPSAIQVYRNGLLEIYGVGFTATQHQLTFTSPPLATDVISVVYQTL